MKGRPARPVLDLVAWPEFDPKVLTSEERKTFHARRAAVELYAAHVAIQEIERQTGVNRKQLYRLVAACTQIHDDGRVYGYRAIKRYARTGTYERKTPPKHSPGDSVFGGSVGAFQYLLKSYPPLEAWLLTKVRGKAISLEQRPEDRIRVAGLTNLHADFLQQCRTLGISALDYPLNTALRGKRALSAWVKGRSLDDFARAAKAAGAKHTKGMPRTGEDGNTAATHALQVVEFDGHRLDIRLTIVLRDPMGFEQRFEIERVWLLVIIDVWSRAVLGYHMSLNREYSRYDVIRTIEKSLEPHRLRKFSVAGLGYGTHGGFPSTKMEELAYATWQRMKLDNAKANLADDVRYALTEFVGCVMDAGPTYTPDDRPYIERFFGTIASKLSSRMPGYTGTNAQDVRRALSDPKGNINLYLTFEELEDLMEASIAEYNGTPHSGLNSLTPLEAVEYSVRGKGQLLNWLPQVKRNTMCLMHTPKLVKVRGYLQQGQRPHINFYGVRYTSATLASTGSFIGQQLRIYYNSQDMRSVRAFTAQGAEIGQLTAQGAWGQVQHDLKLRQEIVRLSGRKRLDAALGEPWLSQFIEQKFAMAKSSRRAASDLARTIRALTQVPPLAEPDGSANLESSAASSLPSERQAAAIVPVEPRDLKIGSGFSGAL